MEKGIERGSTVFLHETLKNMFLHQLPGFLTPSNFILDKKVFSLHPNWYNS